MYSKNSLSILLVEDNPADAHLIRLYLGESSQKMDVFHSQTLFDGLEIIRTKDIDLVLLNLELSDSNGFRTLTRFMESASQLPIVVLTGINNEIIGNQAIKAGAQDYLVKGQFDARILGRVVRYSIQRFAALLKMQDTASKLTTSEKRYEEAQKMARFGNWEMDPVSNEMRWSDEVFRIFGLQPGSIRPAMSEYISYVHSEDRTIVHDFFDNVMKDGRQQQLEHRIIINGHTLKRVSVHAKVLFEESTEKLLLVGVSQDVTDRRSTELLALSQENSSVSDADKLEQFSEMGFLLRKPIASIIQALQLLENSALNPQQEQLLSGLKISTEDLTKSLHRMLNLAVPTSGEPGRFETLFKLKELVLDVQNMLCFGSERKKHQINILIPENMPGSLIADSRSITLMLHNLTTFAMMQTESRGLVTITARVKEKDFKPFLYLSVDDSGRGLTPLQIKNLLGTDHSHLDIDFQSEADASKTAIACACRLSTALGGKLEIRSKEGLGNIFSLEFPVKVAKQLQTPEDGAPAQPLKILVVEDHFLNRISTKKTLTAWSDFVTVDFAENGLAGVDKVRKENYDIVLMDLQMPVMDGIEATMIIRSFSTVPIIALSAAVNKQEEERCFAAGCDDYLAKPFKPCDLYAKITKARTKGKPVAAVIKVN